MQIAITELRGKILETLHKNFNNDEAAIITNYLLWANMSGNKTQGLIKKIKSSRKQPGTEAIRLPGERAQQSRKKAMESGIVEVDEFILKELHFI